MQRKNAYVTVALALCMTLLLSFSLALIESVRQNAGRLETECVAEIALQSVLAEYHREMLEQYNLFVIDSSYGTATYGKDNVEERLKYYLDKNLNYDDVFLSAYLYRDFLKLEASNVKVTDVSWLTDEGGAAFRRCAVAAVESDTGLNLLQQVQDWMQIIEVNGLESSDVAGQKARVDAQLESYDGTEIETEKDVWEMVVINNPTEALEKKRRLGILKLVTEEENLSRAVLVTEGLAGSRLEQEMYHREEVPQEDTGGAENVVETIADQFLFREYLLRYMGHYNAERAEDVLKYQTEYLIAGENSDVENLRKVANRICVIREAANTLYLMGSESKKEQIHLLAEVLCALMLLPQLTPLMEAVIMLGWAFAESVYDMETLLEGGQIPLMKDDSSWHYSLAGALWGNTEESESDRDGMSYQDYLRVFLMLENSDVLTVRAMNMVEADIRCTPGNASFRLDACVICFEADLEFESAYSYQYEIVREKKYK